MNYLQIALEESFFSIGISRPNPAVGAVVVKDGIVVGRGRTQSRLERDFDAVRFEGLTEEEIAEYRRCSDAAAANIRRHLLAEVRAEEARSDGNERT